jgi:hypothetical protein
MFPAWFPFDASLSPAYEIVIFVQVRKAILEPVKYYFVIIYGHKDVPVCFKTFV